MKIAGLEPVTLIDYPDRVAATLFTAGCNLRCPFCHNPELVLPERVAALPAVDLTGVVLQLRERRGFLDGVAITGGEPLMQTGLRAFVERIKALGLLVKLDTNGTHPVALADLLDRKLIDYVAMDLKAPLARYEEFVGRPIDVESVRHSIRLIQDLAPDYEFRTTVAPGLSEQDLVSITDAIHGARRFVLQVFRVPSGKKLVDPSSADRQALGRERIERFWKEVSSAFELGGVRA